MKKMLIPVMAIVLSSCGSGWNKDYAKKTCIKGTSSVAGKDKASTDMVEKLCDCTAEKMVAKYKSESEANKDLKGAETITVDCMKDIYASQKSVVK